MALGVSFLPEFFTVISWLSLLTPNDLLSFTFTFVVQAWGDSVLLPPKGTASVLLPQTGRWRGFLQRSSPWRVQLPLSGGPAHLCCPPWAVNLQPSAPGPVCGPLTAPTYCSGLDFSLHFCCLVTLLPFNLIRDYEVSFIIIYLASLCLLDRKGISCLSQVDPPFC